MDLITSKSSGLDTRGPESSNIPPCGRESWVPSFPSLDSFGFCDFARWKCISPRLREFPPRGEIHAITTVSWMEQKKKLQTVRVYGVGGLGLIMLFELQKPGKHTQKILGHSRIRD